jgi:type I restriction enzyme R subunit
VSAIKWEYDQVERPFCEQLQNMGWQWLEGDVDVPEFSERGSFRDIILRKRLLPALRRINPEADELALERAIRELSLTGGQPLIEKNKRLTESLLSGVYVTDNNQTEATSRNRLIKFIDFDNVVNNDFLVINQFRIEHSGTGGAIIPDIVCFVNGIPLVLVECKSPGVTDPIQSAVDQMLRYSGQRFWIDEPEGVEDLFHHNQLMVATCYYEARVGSLGAQAEHYQEWKDTSPQPLSEVAAELGKPADALKSQEILAAGLLRPANLLDTMRNFILFQVDSGKLIKLVPRYQQLRAVNNAIHKLCNGTTRQQHGVQDQRGGVIWHTQGSGKSVTMVHLVRKLRNTEALRPFKVVVVTDRTDLENQLRETALLTGESIRPDEGDERRSGSATETLKEILREDGPGIVFAMIQKYLERGADVERLEYEVPLPPPRIPADATREELEQYEKAKQTTVLRQTLRDESFPVLNESEKILILVDECHRGHTKTFHANLMQALPNAAKIGFTGTPILKRDSGLTRDIFGEFIDRYTIREGEADGATLPILYEGRTADGLVDQTADLDRKFEDMFKGYSDRELQVIKAKYATEGDVLEAPKLIAEKAQDMLEHYVLKILPNGFKAQVVATSREAAITYQNKLSEARDKLVLDLQGIDRRLIGMSDEDLNEENPRDRFLGYAYRYLPELKDLEIAAIISGNHNDPPSWRQWSDKAKQDDLIGRFKKPLRHSDPSKQDRLAFLCVKNMLLTGFDAPVEQVLYLDRKIVAHDLLQAIARVNRKCGATKSVGYVIDYVGVAQHLHEALEGYEEDFGKPMVSVADELRKLQDRHDRAMELFHSHGIADPEHQIDESVELLEDLRTRIDFVNRLKQFLASLGIVMPRPEAMPYLRNAKILGFIARVAANVYRDDQLNLLGVEPRVKKLIDEHIAGNGIDPTIPPISILDTEFEQEVQKLGTSKARAMQMVHAARHHISINLGSDPTYYKKLSERLEEILHSLKHNWDELVEALRRFIEDARRRGESETVEGLDPKLHGPFFGVIRGALFDGDEEIPEDSLGKLVEVTSEIVEHYRSELRTVGFWRDQVGRSNLESWTVVQLRRSRIVPAEQRESLAAELVDLARARHRFLTE